MISFRRAPGPSGKKGTEEALIRIPVLLPSIISKGMAEKAEAGDVRAGMDTSRLRHQLRRLPV